MRYSTDPKVVLKDFIARRNRILYRGNLEELRSFLKANKLPCPRSKQTLEITFHKSVTAAVGLPKEYRQISKNWLTQRGMRSLDDGDLV
jgi:hypothetical protein